MPENAVMSVTNGLRSMTLVSSREPHEKIPESSNVRRPTARNMFSATSSGYCPIELSLSQSLRLGRSFVKFERMYPGCSDITSMPCGPASTAIACAYEEMNALEPEYTVESGEGKNDACDEVKTMHPRCFAVIIFL
eukprot:Amastigsp_a340126_130.p3 type:complete len:136 gc:universal Amastigsp_a340126_130:367-774(+)